MSAKDTTAKEVIRSALAAFGSLSLEQAALELFRSLGYQSDRRFPLSPNNAEAFIAAFNQNGKFKPGQALVSEWKSVDFLFQLTDSEIRSNGQGAFVFDSKGIFDGAAIESYLFFAIELRGNQYTRTQLAGITRAVNRLFDMPALLLFKYGDTITLSIIRRRLHKKDESKDVLEKVTLIKDIRYAEPHRAHIEILYDLSLPVLYDAHHCTNFVQLSRAWQKTLDISELNKRFYRELADWYFWTVQEVEFPPDTEENRDIRNATNVIRLITRLIFVWFIKEKGLVPDALFNERVVKGLLNFIDFNGTTYYKAILQNLFFATLNTEMNKDRPGSRKFRGKRQDGRDRHYMIHNVFRYTDYFVNPQGTLERYFDNIPFLNGGLFECLDKEISSDGKRNIVRVDGFSDRKDNVLRVPDDLFFSDLHDVDLNEAYGTKSKKYQVRGIINILNSYKFTVHENTPIEEEVALDPELLGKVFENLLASYNPETKSTARKQTGSYYTPREIVDYMVDESLKAHLKAILTGAGMDGEDAQIALDILFVYTEKEHLFTDDECRTLINAVDTLKILDPACGSGAFPMGTLHKLVYILGKLDPHNEKWRARQRQKAIRDTEEAFRIGDQAERQKRLLDIDDAFENNASDYGRKLYLIENCIYGIDIQPIAVQIAKLRFFISLIVDQGSNEARPNLGIRPLPNLETKFVAADALMGIERKGQGGLRNVEIGQKEEELKRVREHHFIARTRETKEKYRKEDERLRGEISDLLKKDGFSVWLVNRLALWNPYDQNASADFFDPEWMFGITSGFDVVIANPPYVRQESIKELKPALKEEYKGFYCGTADIYTYFYKRGIDLLKPAGHLCYIAPNKFMRAAYGKNTRQLLATDVTPRVIIDFCDLPIFDATTYPSILLVEKTKPNKEEGVRIATFTDSKGLEALEETLEAISFSVPVKALKTEGWALEQPEVLRLMEKLRNSGTPLGEYVEGRFYRGILTGLNEAFVIDGETRERLIAEDPKSTELIKPWLRGKDIKRWKAQWAGLYVIFTRHGTDIDRYPAIRAHLEQYRPDLEPKNSENQTRGRKPGSYKWYEIQDNIAYYKEFDQPKIVYPNITRTNVFTFDTSGWFTNQKCFIIPINDQYLLAILNSKVASEWFAATLPLLRGGFYEPSAVFMKDFPVPSVADTQKSAIAALVQQILADPDSPNVPRLETDINRLVYDLYGLTPEEIRIVEGNHHV
ncbi:MAG: Modification methylase PaeR7I [Syntrophorhabdus sp. PtaB.Bin006]|nr:MAG: Modification methylase PaeR7I [Syntrophorhabdus sp. PtaB.Bin006]